MFVWSPEVNFLNHYLPYVGFQLLLFMVAFQNVLYFRAMKALPFNNNRFLANGYLVVLFITTAVYITIAMSVAVGNPIMDTVNNSGQQLFFRLVTYFYFLLAVPVPLVLSWWEMKRSPKHVLTFA